ncbi:MAG TPA: hypothetical protein VKU40_00835 [Thermoanaerobaculia bacterium]|nr:hypothetical protein [Thermoanaerobaculia bacterium]
MTTFPGSPKLLNGGLVLLDPGSGAVQRVIALQYNPESLRRTLAVQGVGEGGDRSEALRLTGPPVETITVEAEIDATDQLEAGDGTAAETGLLVQLAALETVIYPESAQIRANEERATAGTLEIVPMQAPLTLFVWSKSRVMPVRITDFQVTEEAFDPSLHPIRAKVSLTLRVLSVDDLGFTHKGGSLYLTYQQAKERLAGKAPAAVLGQLGLEGIP